MRNLVQQCEIQAKSGDLVEPQMVVNHAGKFFAVDEDWLRRLNSTSRMQSNVVQQLPPWYGRFAEQVCRAIPSRGLRKWLLPKPGHLGMFKLLHSARERSVFSMQARRSTCVEARRGDLFLLPDAYWVTKLRNSVWPAAERARANGAFVASIIYDLIPLTHPQFVGSRRRDSFHDYLVKSISNSDLILAISNTVRDQLQDFIAEEPALRGRETPMLRSFQLGAELSSVEGEVRPELQELFGKPKSPYLMVATFDPRKNHQFLLDAFDQLWQRGNQLDICLVGRIGSRCDDVTQRIFSHPLFGKNLFLFDDLTDAELHHCYRASRGVIFPSIVEGFGLPIVESLWFGKKTFVSDTPIHREVGGNDCSYFPLDHPKVLADQIVQWEKHVHLGVASLQQRRPVSWGESCEQLLSECANAFSNDSKRAAHAA
ncbi:MAG: glycosyltransferase family 1 protein [Planctomycetota bacterium]